MNLVNPGQRFGRLTIIEEDEPQLVGSKNRKAKKWICECDCGNRKSILQECLRRGTTQSCGCIHKEQLIKRNYRHGQRETPLYAIWCSMKRRCFSEKDRSYKNYGARGIKVCDRWLSFENFYMDMKPTYRKGLTLERINNDGDYNPENCTWDTLLVQSNNTRRNRMLTVQGITASLTSLCRIYNIPVTTVKRRLERGWDAKRAFTTPILKEANKLYTVDGITGTRHELCEVFNISYAAVKERLKRGWDIETAYLIPQKNFKTKG